MPSGIALVFIACTTGRSGFTSLIGRLINFRFKASWHLYSILMMPLIVGVAYLSTHYFYGQKFNSVLVPIITPEIWTALPLMLYFIVVQGAERNWDGAYVFANPARKVYPGQGKHHLRSNMVDLALPLSFIIKYNTGKPL